MYIYGTKEKKKGKEETKYMEEGGGEGMKGIIKYFFSC